jgi:hypothetical protein
LPLLPALLCVAVASLRRKSTSRKKLFLPACKNESYLSKGMAYMSEFVEFLNIFYFFFLGILEKGMSEDIICDWY